MSIGSNPSWVVIIKLFKSGEAFSCNRSRFKLLNSSKPKILCSCRGVPPLVSLGQQIFQAHPQYRLCIIKNVKPQAYTEISSGWLPKKPLSSSGNPGWPPEKAKSEKPGWPPKQAISKTQGGPPNKPIVKTQGGPPKSQHPVVKIRSGRPSRIQEVSEGPVKLQVDPRRSQ